MTASESVPGAWGRVHLFHSQLCSRDMHESDSMILLWYSRSYVISHVPKVQAIWDEKVRQARQLPNFFYTYTDTTLHIFATPSSPTVAIKSSYPLLGHHAIEFTSLTPCAFSRRAINLWLGGLFCVESGSSWDHTGQDPATHTARRIGNSHRTPKH